MNGGKRISLSKIAENQLADMQKRENSLDSFYEELTDGIIAVDEEFCIISLNKSAADLLSTSQEQAANKPLLSILKFPANTKKEIERFLHSTNLPKDKITLDLKGLKHTLSILPYNANRQGAKLLLLKSAENINYPYFKELLESSFEGVTILDSNGVIKYESPANESVTGYDTANRINHHAFDNIHPDDRELAKETFQKLLGTSNKKVRQQLKYINASGETRYVDIFGQNLLSHPVIEGIVINFRDITEQKRTAQKLEHQEHQYKKLIELAPVGVLVHAQGILKYVNSEAKKLLGATSDEEFVGRPALDFVHQDYLEMVQGRLQQLQEGNSVPTAKVKLVGKDSTEIEVEIAAAIVMFEGEPAVQAVLHDITEKEKTERQLKQTNNQLRLLTENLPLPVILHVDFQIIFANDKAADLFGLENAHALLGSNVLDFIPRDFHKHFKKKVKGATNFEVIAADEQQQIVRPDGTRVDVEVNATVLPYEGTTAVQVVLNDITERIKTEVALRESKSRYRLMAEHTGKIIYDYNVQTDKVNWEGAIESITGFNREEFEKINLLEWEDLVHPDDKQETIDALNDSIKKQKEFDIIYRMRKQNGSYIYVHDNGTFLYDKMGVSQRMIGTMSDVTEKILAEEELRESESKIKGILTALPDKVILQNATGKILDFYSADKTIDPLYFLNKQFTEIAPPEVKNIYTNAFSNALKSGNLEIAEYSTSVGEKLHSYEARFTAYEENRVLTIIRDVTEQKRVEKALQENEEKLRGIIDALPDQIFIHDRKGTFLEYYSDFEKLVLPEKEFLNKTIYEALPDSMHNYISAFEQSVNSGKMAIAEYDAAIHGEKRTFEARILAYGKDYVLSIVRDIYDKKKAEKDLMRHSRLLQGIADAAVALLANKEPDKAINQALMKIGEMTEADRVYIYKNYPRQKKSLPQVRQIYEWRQEVSLSHKGNSVFQNISYEEAGLERWYDLLSQGRIVTGVVKYFPPKEKELLENQGIKSILIIPLKINQEFWGFICFDDCTNERKWTPQETSLLWAISGSIGSFITQKSTEEALRESEERFDLAVKGANLGLWDWNIKKDRIVYNDQWAVMLGYSLDEMSPDVDTWQKMIHSEDRPHALKTIDDHLAGKTKMYSSEYRMRTKQGDYIWILDQGKVFEKDEAGNPIRALGTQLDITERKLAEEALVRSEQLFSQLFKNAPVGIVMLSADDRVKMVNDSFTKIFQFSQEELHGRKVETLIVPKEMKAEADEISSLVFSGKPTFKETYRTRKDGQKVPVLIYGVPVSSNDQRIAIFGIYVDITERKKAEEELQLMTKELLRTNAELEQFAYVTSHNLRSPVVNLKGLLSLYERLDTGLQNDVIMDKVDQSVNQLDSTLLELTEVVAIKKSIKEKSDEIEFESMLQSVERDLEEQIRSVDAVIHSDFSGKTTITYPVSHLQSILQNLLTNALKYHSPERRPVINISTCAENGFIILKVEDNGVGIDLTKNKDKLFKMYQRLHDQGEGKGLGLYIIKSQVELLGGKIEVESELGRGTTFEVYLQDFPE